MTAEIKARIAVSIRTSKSLLESIESLDLDNPEHFRWARDTMPTLVKVIADLLANMIMLEDESSKED